MSKRKHTTNDNDNNNDNNYDDDELALAIKLSLQQQQPPKKAKTDPIIIDDEEDEDLKKAIEESLKYNNDKPTIEHRPRKNTTNNTSTNSNDKKTNSSNHSASNTFKLNFIEGLSESSNKNTVRIQDLFEKDLQTAFITAYSIDIKWFLSVFPKNVPLTLVKHYDSKVDKPGHFMLSSNHTVLHPPLIPFSNMHAKLMLLLYPNRIRVVISSSNLTREDWSQIGQVVWYQDFPKVKGDGSNADVECEFATDLRHFLTSLTANPQFLKQYDFRGATVKLISSVPGYHVNQSLFRYGHMCLRNIIRTNVPTSTSEQMGDMNKGSVFFQTSSLGSTDPSWVQEFLESTSLPSDSKQKKSKDTSSDSPKLHIIFPTNKSVHVGSRLKIGANMVCLAAKNWNSSKFPKKLLYKSEWSSKYNERSNVIMHSKVILAQDDRDVHRWAYVGSHNFTQAAWGKLQKSGTQLHIKNYELGVVFLNSGANEGGSWASAIPFAYPPQPFGTEEPWLMFE